MGKKHAQARFLSRPVPLPRVRRRVPGNGGHQPRPDMARAIGEIIDRMRERLLAFAVLDIEAAADFERMAQLLAALTAGGAMPPEVE